MGSKAIFAEVLPEEKRNFAFGLYYAGYGAGWLVDSFVTGLLNDNPRATFIVFSVVVQLASIPILRLGGATPGSSVTWNLDGVCATKVTKSHRRLGSGASGRGRVALDAEQNGIPIFGVNRGKHICDIILSWAR